MNEVLASADIYRVHLINCMQAIVYVIACHPVNELVHEILFLVNFSNGSFNNWLNYMVKLKIKVTIKYIMILIANMHAKS